MSRDDFYVLETEDSARKYEILRTHLEKRGKEALHIRSDLISHHAFHYQGTTIVLKKSPIGQYLELEVFCDNKQKSRQVFNELEQLILRKETPAEAR
jgi:hypothetical protein